MLFIKSCNHFFYDSYLFLQIVPNKWEEKHRVPETYYTNNSYTNVINFMKISSNSTQSRQKMQKAQKDKKLR